MGKQQSKDQEEVANKQPIKKIIKKFPWKVDDINPTNKLDEQLKNWKPTKISQAKEQRNQQIQKQRSNLAVSFLSSLAKPTSKDNNSDIASKEFIFKTLTKQQPKKLQPTPQQIKWDIEDQTFIKKEFTHEPTSKPIEHQLVEQDEDQIVVDKIKWLNEQPKIKEIDMTKLIDKDWKANVEKGKFQSDIWSTSFTQGKGQISEFVKEAISRFDEDQQVLNQRNANRRKIKGRYGW